MTDRRTTNRRAFLASSGLALFGGCLSDSKSGSNGTPVPLTDETDGYPPKLGKQPEKQSIDTSRFGYVTVDGTKVPLAPIEVTYYWYLRREARFADARGETQYENSHILGAVLSPAPDGGPTDPTEAWPEDDRVVCYCGCPHHLSSLRAASLIENGFEDVYVIDEGFWEWHRRGYPMAGESVKVKPESYTIRGRTGLEYAGESAWAWHDPSGQREAAPIDRNGNYVLELKFAGITKSSPIRIVTPGYELETSLRDLLSGVVTPPNR